MQSNSIYYYLERKTVWQKGHTVYEKWLLVKCMHPLCFVFCVILKCDMFSRKVYKIIIIVHVLKFQALLKMYSGLKSQNVIKQYSD